jgi:hypothetical protein
MYPGNAPGAQAASVIRQCHRCSIIAQRLMVRLAAGVTIKGCRCVTAVIEFSSRCCTCSTANLLLLLLLSIATA